MQASYADLRGEALNWAMALVFQGRTPVLQDGLVHDCFHDPASERRRPAGRIDYFSDARNLAMPLHSVGLVDVQVSFSPEEPAQRAYCASSNWQGHPVAHFGTTHLEAACRLALMVKGLAAKAAGGSFDPDRLDIPEELLESKVFTFDVYGEFEVHVGSNDVADSEVARVREAFRRATPALEAQGVSLEFEEACGDALERDEAQDDRITLWTDVWLNTEIPCKTQQQAEALLETALEELRADPIVRHGVAVRLAASRYELRSMRWSQTTFRLAI